MYSWGDGALGKLGHRGQESYSLPKLVESLEAKAVSVVCGENHTVILSGTAESDMQLHPN